MGLGFGEDARGMVVARSDRAQPLILIVAWPLCDLTYSHMSPLPSAVIFLYKSTPWGSVLPKKSIKFFHVMQSHGVHLTLGADRAPFGKRSPWLTQTDETAAV